MKTFIIYICFLAGWVVPALTWAGDIKIYLDNSRTEYVMAEEQDCSIYKTTDGRITIGFKAGNLLFEGGPEITFGRKSGVDWDSTVHGLIARYQELCTRFNTGTLTKQEYEKRLGEIETIEREAYTLYQNMIREKSQRRQDLFDELDRETGRSVNHRNSVAQINRKLNSMQQETPIMGKAKKKPMAQGYIPGQESNKNQGKQLKKTMEDMNNDFRPPSKKDTSGNKAVPAK